MRKVESAKEPSVIVWKTVSNPGVLKGRIKDAIVVVAFAVVGLSLHSSSSVHECHMSAVLVCTCPRYLHKPVVSIINK